MIPAIDSQAFDLLEKLTGHVVSQRTGDFAKLFGSETKQDTTSPPAMGTPDVQGWLNSYYAASGSTAGAAVSFQAAPGAASNYTSDDAYGPDAIFAQALDNQAGNAFAQMTGTSAAAITAQLPDVPTVQAQQQFDRMLATENAQRLSTGQAIDTAAYWSDPGPITVNGHTYTAQELGYAGPGQSSGPEPVYLAANHQITGTNSFFVPGFKGTVSGLEPGRYYTLQQLEQAGLPAGQDSSLLTPGSW